MPQRRISIVGGKFWLKKGCTLVRKLTEKELQVGDLITERDGSVTQLKEDGRRHEQQPSPNRTTTRRTSRRGGNTKSYI